MHSRYLFFVKLTYLTLLVVKEFPCDYPDTKFYVATDIVAKEERTSECSYRCYFAISFSALLMLIMHPVIRASKTCIHQHTFCSIDSCYEWPTITLSVFSFLQLS